MREPDEYAEGALEGVIHIPRGHLEAQIETALLTTLPSSSTARAVFALRLPQRRCKNLDTSRSRRWMAALVAGKMKAVHGVSPPASAQSNRIAISGTSSCQKLGLKASKNCRRESPDAWSWRTGFTSRSYLAAAGVGTIGIVDMDDVDESNLQRQILHNIDRVGDRKVDSAKKTLTLLNPDVNVVTYDRDFQRRTLSTSSLVTTSSSMAPTTSPRYVLNDASVKLGIPVVHGSIFRFEGMVSVFHPTEGPTYRDMVPEPPPAELAPSCAEAGVLGVLPGIIGSFRPSKPSRSFSVLVMR